MNKYGFLRSVFRAISETTITRELNLRLSCTFFCVLVSSIKPITDLRMRFLFFGPFLGMGVAVRPDANFPAWDFFWDSWVHYQVIPSEKP